MKKVARATVVPVALALALTGCAAPGASTSARTPVVAIATTTQLGSIVGDIKRQGKACIFIDHNVFHVYSVADRVVVLDRGTVAGEFSTKDITLDQLMEKMYRVAQTGSLD